ncbi:MAG: SCP2 sterol-binding domain-containing protein [Candidatus Lokiarchaeota archaeon]|nr:SCP2 sterol-binding domain-containing protein [Candidatus Lokiarchaeota archaeon]
MKILSEEWVEAFGKAINENPDYKPSALTWEGDMLLLIEPSGNLDHEVRVFIGLHHGECTGTRLVPESEEIETEYTLAGPYDNFVAVTKKEIDPIRAIMAGKLRLEGDMAKLMRHTKAAIEIVNSLGHFEFEFL